ncbi:MAG: NAD(P)(+) transhydrogenase (Re/Si-specific) subunit beta [Acetobacteraceae bacterium]|nr:NAD(P)(+) transhydrogenase (Re/Si-specific) subunit beta [Acetobacteraceae bacterium]
MSENLTSLAYLAAAVLFILALRGLSHPETARRGNLFGIIGMAIALLATALHPGMSLGGLGLVLLGLIIGGAIGAVVALRISMTALPQLVAAFHSLVGLAAVFVAAAALNAPEAFGIGTPGAIRLESLIEMSLGLAIGAITFTGSLIAFAKLQALMSGAPITYRFQHQINLGLGILLALLIIGFVASGGSQVLFWLIALLSLALGFLIIIPIGGADMPVVISMLNSYSGWAACGIGFTIQNLALIVTGALVGASGAILSYIMCKGMNRSIINVLLGGFGAETATAAGGAVGEKAVKSGAPEDAAFILKNASKVIIVPGYGMAVAQAQHAVREMADVLKGEGVEVKYAIHPVAGRMPGHMNVLLAEANVPYDEVFELEAINNEFSTADVAYVIGANDVTNPAAKSDPRSPIYGMPILEVEKAKTVLFVKRSLAPGYAGIDNELFYHDNTMMLFGDAKKVTEEIVQALGR